MYLLPEIRMQIKSWTVQQVLSEFQLLARNHWTWASLLFKVSAGFRALTESLVCSILRFLEPHQQQRRLIWQAEERSLDPRTAVFRSCLLHFVSFLAYSFSFSLNLLYDLTEHMTWASYFSLITFLFNGLRYNLLIGN